MYKNKVVVITGTSQGIGKTIKEEFLKNGAIVCDIDIMPGVYFTGDLSEESILKAFSEKVIEQYNKVDFLSITPLPYLKALPIVASMNLIMLSKLVCRLLFIFLNFFLPFLQMIHAL